MADSSAEGTSPQVTFKVKTSGDKTHEITMPESSLVSELKEKLSGPEFEDVPSDRQRLIYSGRVLKNEEPLATYKIKPGNTVHLVKSAASNRPAQQSSSASSSVPGAGTAPQIPTNMAAGTANNPLAGLTGARYAGLTNLPSADTFGPDGGMSGSMMNEDDMVNLLSNPNMAQQMNEMMGSDMFRNMMEQHPAFRNNRGLLDLMQTPYMRSMITNPDFIRQSMRMSRQNGGGGDGAGAFPMPGVTNNTPGGQGGEGNADNAGAPGGGQNPFGAFAQQAGGAGADPGAAFNPFALFGQQPPAAAAGGQTEGNNAQTANPNPENPASADGGNNPQPPNPFASLFGGMPGASPAGMGGAGASPFGNLPPPSPEALQQMMQLLGGGAGGGAPGAAPGAGGLGGLGGAGGPSPEALQQMMQMLGGGAGGAGGGMGGLFNTPSAPEDNRPPEERYADQLRQLNDMGFYDFDRNVSALRRSGGSVQGAIEHLLG